MCLTVCEPTPAGSEGIRADDRDHMTTAATTGLRWRPEPPGAPNPAWPPVLVAEDLIARGVVAAFTGRTGGGSRPPFHELNLGLRIGDAPDRVLANRRRVLTVLGLAGRPLAAVRQVHGAGVVDVTAAALPAGPPEGKPPLAEADGLVTTDPTAVLMVLAADCVPVLLADPDARAVAALHAGWRGLAAGIIEQGVARLTSAGAQPGRTTALVGPAVSPGVYEVGEDVQAAVAGRYPQAAATTRTGTPALDLPAAAVAALTGAGITQIRVAGECTYSQPERFFSHRRDSRQAGRQAGIIALTSPGVA